MTDAPVVVWEGSPKLRDFLVPIESLAPHPENPRVGNVDVVAGSLARFGQRTPIVAASQLIYKGNHTWRAARDVLGWTHIAVLSGDDLAEDELDAYLLADNRTSDLGEYEDEKLLAALERLTAADGGLVGTGYSADDVDGLRARLARLAENGGGAAARTDAEKVQARADAETMREVSLVLSEAQYDRFGVYVKMLRKSYRTEGVVDTVFRAVEEAAKAL